MIKLLLIEIYYSILSFIFHLLVGCISVWVRFPFMTHMQNQSVVFLYTIVWPWFVRLYGRYSTRQSSRIIFMYKRANHGGGLTMIKLLLIGIYYSILSFIFHLLVGCISVWVRFPFMTHMQNQSVVFLWYLSLNFTIIDPFEMYGHTSIFSAMFTKRDKVLLTSHVLGPVVQN